jgi:hypothetical protein
MDMKNPSLFFEENDKEVKVQTPVRVKHEPSMSLFFKEKEEKLYSNGSKSSHILKSPAQSPRESIRLRDKERKNYNDSDPEDDGLYAMEEDDLVRDEGNLFVQFHSEFEELLP